MIQGYCQDCGKMVEMFHVETVQLSNLVFVHTGKCSCSGRIYKSISDENIIINKRGHKYPKTVYQGKRTPRRLIEDHNGQTIINNGKTIKTKSKEGAIETVQELKKKGKK